MTYTIPETARENLTKILEKYAKKAVRYGSSLNYSMSEAFWQNFNARDEHNEIIGSFPVEVFNLDLEDNGVIKCGDYSILAAIHHMDGGNIVNNFTDRRDVEWTRIAPKCEHCGTNHDRKITFIVMTTAIAMIRRLEISLVTGVLSKKSMIFFIVILLGWSGCPSRGSRCPNYR